MNLTAVWVLVAVSAQVRHVGSWICVIYFARACPSGQSALRTMRFTTSRSTVHATCIRQDRCTLSTTVEKRNIYGTYIFIQSPSFTGCRLCRQTLTTWWLDGSLAFCYLIFLLIAENLPPKKALLDPTWLILQWFSGTFKHFYEILWITQIPGFCLARKFASLRCRDPAPKEAFAQSQLAAISFS